jgi:tetratricopeptide (TPR) repeat protein
LAKKHYSEAVTYYVHAVELEPSWLEVYRTLGRVYLTDIGKPTIALEYLDRALALNDADCSSLYWRGETLVRLSPPRNFEGRESAKTLSTVCPGRGSFTQLAEMHLRLNDWQAAIQTYSFALAFSDAPDALPWIYYGMGRAYEGLGDHDNAMRYWRMALAAGASPQLREELVAEGVKGP